VAASVSTIFRRPIEEISMYPGKLPEHGQTNTAEYIYNWSGYTTTYPPPFETSDQAEIASRLKGLLVNCYGIF
jgi:hypothetical protein